MELVFIHGWGFDARFWDALCAFLPEFRHRRVDRGFYGQPSALPISGDAILIGHSLGFVHGMQQRRDWRGWIAINSFPRFMRTETQPGCVTPAQLRELKIGLASDADKALQGFYDLIEAEPPEGSPDVERLRAGLDELRDCDIGAVLESVEAPGLVLAGRDDPLVPPKTSLALCGLAQKGSLLWHDTGAHMLPQRHPEWCANAIKDFLAGMTA